MTEIVAVINPAAGGGTACAVWEELRRAEPRLAQARVVQAPSREAQRAELAPLIEAGIERLLVLGGDGSLHAIANLLLEMGQGARVAIGPVPLGTGADFVRGLGLPRDPRACVARLLTARARPIDALAVVTDDGRRVFVINVASAGISGLVDEAVNALVRPGQAAYLRATLGAVRRYRPVACRVSVDGALWYQGDILLLVVANGRYFGRGMHISPRAELDDGLADVVLVGAVPRWQLAVRLPQLYFGTHLESRYVQWRRGREVRLEPLAPLPSFDLDGENWPSGAARFAVLPAALRVLV